MNTFNIVLIVILAVFLAVGAVIGLLKGFTRSLFTVFTNLTAGLCAILLARPIVSFFVKLPIIADALNDVLIGTALEDAAESFLVLLASITSALAAPAIFFLLYILFYLILKIPFYFIYKACVKDDETPSKPLGALICALNSVIFFIFLFAPLAGYYNTGLSVAERFNDLPKDSQIAAIFELEGEPIEVSNIPVLDFVYTTGGKAMFNHLSTIEYNNEKITFSDEITAISKVALNAGLLIENGHSDIRIDAKKCSDDLSLALSESVIIRGLTVEGLKVLALEYENGDFDDEWLAEAETAGLLPIIDKLAAEYTACDAGMAVEDLNTIASLLGAVSGSELLDTLASSETEVPADDILALVADEDLLYDVLLALYENPRFKGILPQLSDVGVVFICKAAEIDPSGAPKNTTDMTSITKSDIKAEAAALSVAFENFAEALNSSTADLSTLALFSTAISELEDSFLFGHTVDYITVALIKENASQSLGDLGLSEEALDSLTDILGSGFFK